MAKEVHKLAHFRVCLLDSSDGRVIVIKEAESSLVSKVKEKQDKDPILLELKANVHKEMVMNFQ